MKILLLFLLTSCGSLSQLFFSEDNSKLQFKEYQKYGVADYKNHLSQLGEYYLNNEVTKKYKLNYSNKRYLSGIINKLQNSNELFLDKKIPIKFAIIKESKPVYFSLPNGQIIFSDGLISKYVKHEGILVSIIAYELMRINKGLYKKKIIVPTGSIDLYDIIGLTTIPVKLRIETNAWAYLLLYRTSLYSDSYLNWIQTKNKHNVDFNLLENDDEIIQQEFQFRKFLISRGLEKSTLGETIRSSKGFYQLKGSIRRH